MNIPVTLINGSKIPADIFSSVVSELKTDSLSFDPSSVFSSMQFLKNLKDETSNLIFIPVSFFKNIQNDIQFNKKGIYWILVDDSSNIEPNLFQLHQIGKISEIAENPVSLIRLQSIVQSVVKDIIKTDRLEKLYTQFIHQQDSLRKLTNIGIALSNEPDIETLLDSILDIAMELTDSDSGTLYFIEQNHENTDTQKLRFIYTKNNSLEVPFQNSVMDVSNNSISGYCALSGKTLNIVDVGNIPSSEVFHFNDKFDQSIGYRSKSMLVTPLKNYKKEIIGVLQLINKKKNPISHLSSQEIVDAEVLPFTEFDINLIESFGSQAAIAVENKNLVARIQDQLRQVKIAQEEKTKSLVTLVAGVAHEINNPVNFITSSIIPLRRDVADIKSIMQFLEPLTIVDPDDFDSEETPEYWQRYRGAMKNLIKAIKDQDLNPSIDEIHDLLDGIESGSTRIAEIVRSLRSYSMLEEQNSSIVDLNKTAEISIKSAQKEYKKPVFIKTVFADIPMVHANSDLIHIAFVEILKNAIEFVDEKGNIEVSSKATPREVIICFDDNGIGVSPDVVSKIFDPFFTTKEIGKGIGMGLSIAYTIAQRHNGNLRLVPKSGQGARFEISFPLGLQS